jgi:hypothetical protein
MATLVLSTVGTALGGPVGGAIGALIGQSLDQQLLAPATRGPRLGDLSVQTSSYGTQIPRVYGSMRVAGSVVWATDLVESEQTSGAKGQPDVTYSYSVSLAVALSSRTARSIGRIWADGNLLRGAEGDFKVPTTFRFYDGSEDQDVDPLIASVEGIANTPAYRGLALAVFENLELAAFGNRIPFMTFELIADSGAPTISAILSDASAGAIASDDGGTIEGYAAYGASVAAAVQPLVDCFDLPLFDDGSTLRSPLGGAPVAIGADELGNSADGSKAAKLQREQTPVSDVPSTLRLTYYDPQRDYQTGETRASAADRATREVQQQLPAVLGADDAKTLAQQMLARQWSARDRITLRLPPARIALEPGATVQPEIAPGSWRVERSTIDGFVTILELRTSWQPQSQVLGEAGRIVGTSDIVAARATMALLDVPNLAAVDGSGPQLAIAATSPDGGWTARPLSVGVSGQMVMTQTAAAKAVLGHASSLLAPADPYLIDAVSSVDVQLVDAQQWLTSCDDEALADGVNLAVIGNELVQFAEAAPVGNGRFRLSRLLRGRGGTEWAAARHEPGELFCMLAPNTLRSIAIPPWARGSTVIATARDGATASLDFSAESVRPLSPIALSAATNPDGSLSLGWSRRSRAGFAWLDEVDTPIGENREQYLVTIAGAAGAFEMTTDASNAAIALADVSSLGSGAATIEVRQLGDWAASRPAQLTIDLP